MDDNPVILITRPEPQATRFAQALSTLIPADIAIKVIPLMRAEFLAGLIDGTSERFVAFTSENGVRAADAIWEGPKGTAFAVGDRTAEVAGAHGWEAMSASGTAADLAAMIAAKTESKRILWPCGQVVKSDLVDEGKRLGITIDPLVVYEMRTTGAEDEIRKVANSARNVILPVFSAVSAKALSACLNGVASAIHLVAISDEVGAAFGPTSAVEIAKAPNADEMIQAISKIFPTTRLEGDRRDV